MPLFSVIIPTKNRASLLRGAIVSVLKQKHVDFELIVVDDHSEDETIAVINSFQDVRIKYILNKSEERSAARNTGIDRAVGDYICFLDDDDYYSENYLADFYTYLSEHYFPKDIILRTGFIKVFEDGKQKKSAMYDAKKHKNAIRFAAYNMCGVWTLCIPKDILDVNRFDERYNLYEDTQLIIAMFLKLKMIQINNFNYYYCIYNQMDSIKIEGGPGIQSNCQNNINGIQNLFNGYPEIYSYLTSGDKNFLMAEKYIQYSGKSLYPRDKRMLFQLSVENGVYFKLWKYYLKHLTWSILNILK